MNTNKTYENPIIFADYSDPDVVKVGNGYYLTSSSFNYTPGLPILYSDDLVNWKHIGYAVQSLGRGFESPRHSEGIWAPSIRYYNDMFYIYYGMPDEGLFVVRGRFKKDIPASVSVLESALTGHPDSSNADGSCDFISDHGMDLHVPGMEDKSIVWDEPKLVLKGKGLIDPCPFIDDDGRFYLIHAYAKSRIGFKSILGMMELDKEGLGPVSEDHFIFLGGLVDESGMEQTGKRYKYPECDTPDEKKNPAITIEGPKVYKRKGFYYIFAPAGGVRNGWQLALRSKNISGPYECRVVMHQGKTVINGPHQGGLVSDDAGCDLFIHFQDMGAYGRVCHLQPVTWKNDWPVIGTDDGTGCGEPVMTGTYPFCKRESGKDAPELNKAGFETSTDLQWLGDYSTEFFEVVTSKDFVVSKDMTDLYHGQNAYNGSAGDRKLKLIALNYQGASPVLWKCANVLTRKIDRRAFDVRLTFDVSGMLKGDRAGVTLMGGEYGFIECERILTDKKETEYRIYYGISETEPSGKKETRNLLRTLEGELSHFTVTLTMSDEGKSLNVEECLPVVTFGYGIGNENDVEIYALEEKFKPSDHTWTGARVGLYAISKASRGGYVILDEFNLS